MLMEKDERADCGAKATVFTGELARAASFCGAAGQLRKCPSTTRSAGMGDGTPSLPVVRGAPMGGARPPIPTLLSLPRDREALLTSMLHTEEFAYD
jgi:hypothetical protein